MVIHDWGSTLGFDWANHDRDAVKGIAYMEAMVERQFWASRTASECDRPSGATFRCRAATVLQGNFASEVCTAMVDCSRPDSGLTTGSPTEGRTTYDRDFGS